MFELATNACVVLEFHSAKQAGASIQWSDGAGVGLFEVDCSWFSANYTFPLQATTFPPKWSVHYSPPSPLRISRNLTCYPSITYNPKKCKRPFKQLDKIQGVKRPPCRTLGLHKRGRSQTVFAACYRRRWQTCSGRCGQFGCYVFQRTATETVFKQFAVYWSNAGSICFLLFQKLLYPMLVA